MKLRIRRRFQSLIDLNITALNIGTFLPWPRVLLFRQPPAKTYLNARQSNSPAFFMVSVGDKWDLFYLLSTHVRQAFSTRRHNERREKNTDSAEVVPVCEQNSCWVNIRTQCEGKHIKLWNFVVDQTVFFGWTRQRSIGQPYNVLWVTLTTFSWWTERRFLGGPDKFSRWAWQLYLSVPHNFFQVSLTTFSGCTWQRFRWTSQRSLCESYDVLKLWLSDSCAE